MSRRTEHCARPVLRSSLLHSNFWFPTRGHPARFTHCLARASADRKVEIGRHIAAGSTNRAANCLRTVESIVRWCTAILLAAPGAVHQLEEPASGLRTKRRHAGKFHAFNSLTGKTGLDAGGL